MNTILIVDDEPPLHTLIQETLRDEGYRFISAHDAEGGQKQLQQMGALVSAVILDWMLPGMSGIDLLRWIKKHPTLKSVPVIVHTVRMDPESVRTGIDNGAYYYLTKPTDPGVMVSIVRAAVRDFTYVRSLLARVDPTEDSFKLMVEGTFRFRRIQEGEALAIRIANACPCPEDVLQISELFVNAVEHGNLGISYEEKTKYMADGTWYSVIEHLLSRPDYASKYVEVKVRQQHGKLTVHITDQGAGFDFQRYLKLDADRVFDNHGRGIAIANSFLDLQYFGNGNSVLVTVPLNQSS